MISSILNVRHLGSFRAGLSRSTSTTKKLGPQVGTKTLRFGSTKIDKPAPPCRNGASARTNEKRGTSAVAPKLLNLDWTNASILLKPLCHAAICNLGSSIAAEGRERSPFAFQQVKGIKSSFECLCIRSHPISLHMACKVRLGREIRKRTLNIIAELRSNYFNININIKAIW